MSLTINVSFLKLEESQILSNVIISVICLFVAHRLGFDTGVV